MLVQLFHLPSEAQSSREAEDPDILVLSQTPYHLNARSAITAHPQTCRKWMDTLRRVTRTDSSARSQTHTAGHSCKRQRTLDR